MKKSLKFSKRFHHIQKNKVLKTINSPKIFGSKSKSIKLSFTGFGLIVAPTTASVGCGDAVTTKSRKENLKKKR